MAVCVKEVVLFGLDHHQGLIDGIIRDLGPEVEQVAFDVKLILAEAVTNAYFHGNGEDCTKPIYIRYSLDGSHLNLQVEDTGGKSGYRDIPLDIDESRLLDEGGRGLYLIRSFSDHVEMVDNTINIVKILECQ
jgi:serine/threonine-protein kinase RsbW